MATYLIRHSPVLSGEVEVHAAKNAVLPLLAAGLLTEEPLVFCLLYTSPSPRD